MPIEETENTIRIRVKDPDLFIDTSFATIVLSKEQGIKVVIGKLKSDPDGPTHVQVYLFEKEKWSASEAEKWVEEHKKRSGMEKRSFDIEFRVTGDTRGVILAGIAIPYNHLSDNPIPGLPNVKEKILPGAFKRSLESGSDVMMLWNHEVKYVLGRRSAGTLKLEDSMSGVMFENVSPSSQWAKDLIHSIKRRDVSNMSFSFTDNVEPSWTREGKEYVRNVRDATLYEISVVTFPVYESTSVYARSSDLMVVDGNIILDYASPEKIIERENARVGRFDDLMHQFESLKEQWK